RQPNPATIPKISPSRSVKRAPAWIREARIHRSTRKKAVAGASKVLVVCVQKLIGSSAHPNPASTPVIRPRPPMEARRGRRAKVADEKLDVRTIVAMVPAGPVPKIRYRKLRRIG